MKNHVYVHQLPLWFQKRIAKVFKTNANIRKAIAENRAEINLGNKELMALFKFTEEELISLFPYIYGDINENN